MAVTRNMQNVERESTTVLLVTFYFLLHFCSWEGESMKRWVGVLLLLMPLIISACGGGGGGGDEPKPSSTWDEMNWDENNWA